MKTAILKTNLWDDDDFFELNIDTKLLYLLLMSAPERGVSDIYKVSNRILSARSGLSSDQLEICKKQLAEKGLVSFDKSYIKLIGSAYVLPKKGRFTEQALTREYEEVPKETLDYFNSSLIVEYNNNTIHNNKDKDNNINIDVNKDNSKKEINDLFLEWNEVVGYEIQSNIQKNRYACNNLLKKHGKDKLMQLLRGVALSQSDNFAPRVSDFVSLQSKLSELLAWGKRQSSIKVKGVIKI